MSVKATKSTENKNNSKMLKDVDESLMEGWALGMTLGEVLDSLPQKLRDFILDRQYNVPDIGNGTIQLSLDISE